MKSFDAVERLYAKYVRTRFPLPTDTDIAALETKMGTPLPLEYRSFLAKFNGGYFDDAPFEMDDERCPRDALTTLWGVRTPKKGTDLEDTLDIFDDNHPAIVLPFGYTMMGNLLLMELKGDVAENIVLKLAGKQDYIYVAADFIGFIGLIGT